MTDFEYDQIPKYTDKKQTSIKYKTQSTIDLEFWKAATSFITLLDDKPTQGLTFQQYE